MTASSGRFESRGWGAALCAMLAFPVAARATPYLALEKPAAEVNFVVTTYEVRGHAVDLVDPIVLSNAASGDAVSFPSDRGLSNSLWSAPPIRLAVGSNLLVAAAADSEGHVLTAAMTVVRGGGGPPAVWFTGGTVPATGFLRRVAGGFNGQVAGNVLVTNLTAGTWAIAPPSADAALTWSSPPLPFLAGTNLLVVRATNALGVSTSAQMQVVIPGSKPPRDIRRLYWLSKPDSHIRSSSLGADPPVDVITDVASIATPAMVYDPIHGKIYWTHYDYIGRCNVDGSGREIIYSAPGAYVASLAIDCENGFLFWTEVGTDQLHMSELDGGFQHTLMDGVRDAYGVAADPYRSQVYWAETGDYRVKRCSYSGGRVEDLSGAQGSAIAGDFVHGYLYHATLVGTLIRTDLQGNDAVVIGAGDNPVVSPEEGRLYYKVNDEVRRSDLDGAHAETLLRIVEGDCSALAIDVGDVAASRISLHISGSPESHDRPSRMGYGVHFFTSSVPVTCSVTSPADESVCALPGAESEFPCERFVCLGWSGSGSAPATGAATVASFLLQTNSALVWQWQRQVGLALRAVHGAIAGASPGYQVAGSLLELQQVPDAGYAFTGWNVDGVPAGEDSGTPMLVVTADAPHVVQAFFDEVPGWFEPDLWLDAPSTPVTVAEIVLSGSNNLHVVGEVTATNEDSGWSATFAPALLSGAWTSPPVPLAFGLNHLRVTGTNLFGLASACSTLVLRGGDQSPQLRVEGAESEIAFNTEAMALVGSNNLHVIGTLVVSNLDTGAAAAFEAPAWNPLSWTSPRISLLVGTNHFVVSGSNAHGAVASDMTEVFRPGGLAPLFRVDPPPPIVAFTQDVLCLTGSNNAHVVGQMLFSNAADQATAAMDAPDLLPRIWTSPPLPLALGVNAWSIRGTNMNGQTADVTVQVERAGLGAPQVRVSTTNRAVPYLTMGLALAGSNNMHVVGTMWVSNAANGAVAAFAAPTGPEYTWVAPSIALAVGDNTVRVSGVNAIDETASAVLVVRRGAPLYRYVAQGSPSPAPPYTSWTTAARTIQEAVNWSDGDIILVSNGVYATGGVTAGGLVTNRVAATNSVVIQSVRGAASTIIVGAGSQGATGVRGVYLSSNAQLIGFTVRDGRTHDYGVDRVPDLCGGGIYAEPGAVVRSCMVTRCSAVFGGGIFGGQVEWCDLVSNDAVRVINPPVATEGGGASGSRILHSRLAGNTAVHHGGGASSGWIEDSVVTGNGTRDGGGLSSMHAIRSTIVSNTAFWSGGAAIWSDLHNCVIAFNQAPDPDYGIGGATMMSLVMHCTVISNICPNGEIVSADPVNCLLSSDYTNLPFSAIFQNAAAGDYRLVPGSPAIDACAEEVEEEDFLGRGRPLDGDNDGRAASDLGAFEYVHPLADSDHDGLADTNEVDTLHTNPARADTDGDGSDDRGEIIAGTDPLAWSSVLRVFHDRPSSSQAGDGTLLLEWPTVPGHRYTLMVSGDLSHWGYAAECVDQPGDGSVLAVRRPLPLTTEYYRIQVRKE